MKLVLKSKKVAIIAGVSAAVLVTALGVGLGVGLSTSTTDSSESSEHYISFSGIGVTPAEINNGKKTVDGTEYQIKKEGDSYFLKAPTSTFNLSSRIIKAGEYQALPYTIGKIYTEMTVMGEGKDNFYDINFITPSLNVGVVRIPNDGKIYGGYVENDEGNGYKMDDKLAQYFPNGFQIGDFNPDGYGGVNMLMLEKLIQLRNASESTLSQEFIDNLDDSTTKFTRFKFTKYGAEIRLWTNTNPTTPSEIGYAPDNANTSTSNTPTGSGNKPFLFDAGSRPSWDTHKQKDIEFSIMKFKKKDGTSYKLTLEKEVDDLDDVVIQVPLNDLYTPILLQQGKTIHPLLGLVKPDATGNIRFDNSVITEDGNQPTIQVNDDNSVTLPTLLIKLEKPIFNEADYATLTTGNDNKANELVISVNPVWKDYFQAVANDERVKTKAKNAKITIRFKDSTPENDWNDIKEFGVYDKRAVDVFFTYSDELHSLDKENIVAPLLENGILENNLNNSDYFSDYWRIDAKLTDGINKNKYGLYPFSQRTPLIAYNVDYLPNGLDLSGNKTMADYLYQGDLGNAEDVQKAVDPQTVTSEQKNGLLASGILPLGGAVWAIDYYNQEKKDQQPNQQDILWRKITRSTGDTTDPDEKDYWSVFADPGLKDNSQFQKWVDHNRNSNMHRVTNDLDNNHYDIAALFNEHIGAIMISSFWADTNWRNGAVREAGSDEQKKAFSENKIKFQSIPKAFSSGLYWAMSNVLKNDPKKQAVAEMFLNVLTDPKQSKEFKSATDQIPARTDIDLSNGFDPITANVIRATVNTPTVRILRDEWVWQAFQSASSAIPTYNGQNLYEDIANDYKSKLEAAANVNRLFAPE